MVSRYGSIFRQDLVLLAVFSITRVLFVLSYLYVCVFSFLQESLDVMSTNDDNTLGFNLELYSRYMDAAKVCEICIGKLGSYLTL